MGRGYIQQLGKLGLAKIPLLPGFVDSISYLFAFIIQYTVLYILWRIVIWLNNL